MSVQLKKLLITLILLGLAGISPNLFPAAQAGIASFPSLVKQLLFPSAGLILIMIIALKVLKYNDLSRLAVNGIVAGIISTIALEIIRETGFHLEWMPGDLPKLMGVVMLNQFATGPDVWSDLAGWLIIFGTAPCSV